MPDDQGAEPPPIRRHILWGVLVGFLVNAPWLFAAIDSVGDRYNSALFALVFTFSVNCLVYGFLALKKRPREFWKGYSLAVVVILLVVPTLCR